MTQYITATIGSTPMLRLQHLLPDNSAAVYVKLEYLNPTGSYKDRMASTIIATAEKQGRLQKGMTVVECTAGGTGVSLAFICSLKGYPFKVISSDAFAKEKLLSMRIFGAELELIESEGGKITPDLIPRMIERVKELGTSKDVYWTDQFNNVAALEGYREMGREILLQVDGTVDAFCAAVGTAGMLAGVSQMLKKAQESTQVVVLEPASAPLLSKGIKGSHTIDGISVGFIPPLLQHAHYDHILTIDEAEARYTAKLLAQKEGIFAGTSTDLNVAAAIRLAKEMGSGKSVVTVACDSGMKYINSGLYD